MNSRSLSLALAAVVAGCVSLEGLTGGEEPLDPHQPGTPTLACAASDAPQCEHGRCVDDDGEPRCECDAGWTGPTCAECAVGAPCGAPTCEATTCAAHSTCDESTGAPRCVCVPGYSASDGECAWSGVVADPGFADDPEGSWELLGGVTIDAGHPGFDDPGLAELRTAACTSAFAKQSIVTPPPESAEPLGLQLSGSATCKLFAVTPPGVPPSANKGPCIRPISVRVAGYGLEPIPLAVNGVPVRGQVCLGERALGGTIPLEVFATSCSATTTSVVVDHLSVAPAPGCPAPGEIPNADFEGTGGWEASAAGAEVASGVGNNGTRGGRLHRTQRCGSTPTLTGTISVPLSAPAHPALTFTVNGTKNRRMSVTSNGLRIGSITGAAVFQKASLCLPERLRGMAGSLAFALEDDGPGACNDPDDSAFVFDDLAIEDDPSCGAQVFVVDGGFERSDTGNYWAQSKNGGTVSFLKGSGARTGSGYARIAQTSCDAATRMTQTVTLPPLTPGAGGPAVEFHYKTTGATDITHYGLGQPLAPASDWTAVKQCYPGRRAGFGQTVEFRISTGEACASGSLSIDDVRVGLDPTCPE